MGGSILSDLKTLRKAGKSLGKKAEVFRIKKTFIRTD